MLPNLANCHIFIIYEHTLIAKSSLFSESLILIREIKTFYIQFFRFRIVYALTHFMLLVLASFYTRSFLFSMATKEISGMELVNWGRGHSVHPPPPFCWEGGWTSNQIFKKRRGTWQNQTFSGELLGKRGWLLEGGACNFQVKNKIWNIEWQKKFASKNIFLCHNLEFKLGHFK